MVWENNFSPQVTTYSLNGTQVYRSESNPGGGGSECPNMGRGLMCKLLHGFGEAIAKR